MTVKTANRKDNSYDKFCKVHRFVGTSVRTNFYSSCQMMSHSISACRSREGVTAGHSCDDECVGAPSLSNERGGGSLLWTAQVPPLIEATYHRTLAHCLERLTDQGARPSLLFFNPDRQSKIVTRQSRVSDRSFFRFHRAPLTLLGMMNPLCPFRALRRFVPPSLRRCPEIELIPSEPRSYEVSQPRPGR